MEKRNGGTIIGTANRAVIEDSLIEFNSYDENVWEKTMFNTETGGYVVTELRRIPPIRLKRLRATFNKEQDMCYDLAGFGFGVKHIYERNNKADPDINLTRGMHSIVEINGIKADLKSLRTSNNIRREAKDVFESGKGCFVVFQFEQHDRRIPFEIYKLSKKGWHGLYYYADEKKRHDF
jgi:hypothetical protein